MAPIGSVVQWAHPLQISRLDLGAGSEQRSCAGGMSVVTGCEQRRLGTRTINMSPPGVGPFCQAGVYGWQVACRSGFIQPPREVSHSEETIDGLQQQA